MEGGGVREPGGKDFLKELRVCNKSEGVTDTPAANVGNCPLLAVEGLAPGAAPPPRTEGGGLEGSFGGIFLGGPPGGREGGKPMEAGGEGRKEEVERAPKLVSPFLDSVTSTLGRSGVEGNLDEVEGDAGYGETLMEEPEEEGVKGGVKEGGGLSAPCELLEFPP